jgi:hypothetical protein
MAFESNTEYLAASVFRFASEHMAEDEAVAVFRRLCQEPGADIRMKRMQATLTL